VIEIPKNNMRDQDQPSYQSLFHLLSYQEIPTTRFFADGEGSRGELKKRVNVIFYGIKQRRKKSTSVEF
jgi:hypothetical protein